MSIAVLVVIGLVLGLRLFAMTPMAHSIVANQIESTSTRGQTIQVEGLQGDLLGRITIERINVSDGEGVWLSIDETELAWSPMALISGELRLKTLSVNEINARRRPNLLPSTSETQTSFVDCYQLETLDIERLILANQVLGPAQAYTIAGSLDATDTSGEVALNLQPIVAVGDTLTVDLRWGGEVPLEGDLALNGAPSGLFATLLDLPTGTPFTASLQASGGPTDWTLLANAQAGETEVLDLRASRADEAYQSSGSLLLAPFGRLSPIAARIGPRLSGSVERGANGLLFANIQTDRGGFAGQGRLMDEAGVTRVEDFVLAISSLDAAAVTRFETLDLPAARATGVLELEGQDVRFNGDLSIPSASFRGYGVGSFISRGDHAWRAGGLDLHTALSFDRPIGLPEALSDRLSSDLSAELQSRFDLDTRRLVIAGASLRSGADTIEGAGSYDLSGPIDLGGQLRLTQFNPLETLAGSWRVQGQSLTELDTEFDGRAAIPEAQTMLSQLIGQTLNAKVELSRHASSLELVTLRLQSDRIQMQASGALNDGQIQLAGTLDAPALETPTFSASGLTSQFQLTGPATRPRIKTNTGIADFTASGETLSDTTLRASGTLETTHSFDLDLTSTFRDAPLSARANGAVSEGAVDIEAINMLWADLRADGSAQVDLTAFQNSTLGLIVSGQAPLVSNIEGEVTYTASVLNADIAIEDATFAGAQLRSADLIASGTWPLFTGDLSFAGEVPFWGGSGPIAGTHQWGLNPEEGLLTLDGQAELAGQVFDITKPLRLDYAETLRAEGSLEAFGGAIDVRFDNSGMTPSQITLTGLEMQSLGALIQRPGLRGRISGAADLVISETGLNGDGAFQIQGLARGDGAQADVELRTSIVNDAVSVALQARDEEDDLSLDATGETRLQQAGTIASIRPVPGALFPVRITGSGPIAPLWALAAPSDLRLDGAFDVDLSNGDGRAFRFSGPAEIRDGVFEDGFTGLHLEEINAQADLTPDAISLLEATARGGNSGRLEASGAYRFDGDSDVTLVLNRLNALNRSDVSAEISGEARLDRRQRRTHIEGDLRVDQARINLSKLPGAGYTTLDVVFADPGEPLEATAPEREAISLNLNVSADRRVFVTGPGVESEWGLAARVTGSPGAPQVNGRATLVRGEADLLSRSFRLTEGVVRFAGDPQDSEVALRADRTSDGITTSINLVGTVTDPEITLSSDPSLPDDEILARVLFGRSPSNLSPLQAAQLAAAAAQLAGGDAISLTGQLEEATGLDRLDFGFDEDGEATLSTGKYLADDLYLEVESGGSGAPGVALEWTPLANVELDAEIDPELGPKVAIQWKRDFDRLPGEAAPEPPARPSSNE